ncbi:DUF2975 domain-containing protein [Lacinutrix sp. Bg11-31]|uniref:DUF2975 domain-containing protein n=1 Tax=Lacinutrix sp. Bg11-31 TaxID=2057808 RepID=UPI000C312C05|nr:DUF2975 domain-containing protein [Lacinutrix sp. Bg11-31]AUC83101.1 hypothetical protein CW733_13560 [Lacinutrix sp. Bg11-31]
MKKIKILHWFVITLIVIFIIHFLTNMYLTFYTPGFMNFGDEHYSQFIFGYYTQFVGLTFSILSFVALFFLRKGLGVTIKKGFFNKNSSKKFKIAGKLFLVSGVLSLLWDFTLLIYSKGEILFVGSIISDILLLLIGFGLLIIADFITNGNTIQQENDLTI